MAKEMSKLTALLAALMLLAPVLPGCGYAETHRKTTYGAGIGAAGGAVIGGLTKGSKGALYGAVIGGLAGGAVGAYLDHRDKSAEETNRENDYDAAQGVRIRLAEVRTEPRTTTPGREVNLTATYALMAPDPTQELTVTETRRVTLDGRTVEELPVTVVRTPGTYTSTLPVKLDGDAGAGTYEVHTTVAVSGQSSQADTYFTVQ